MNSLKIYNDTEFGHNLSRLENAQKDLVNRGEQALFDIFAV